MSVFPATTIILFSFYISLVYPISFTFRVKLFTKTIPFTKKREIKVTLPSKYNIADIILLFINCIHYFMGKYW